MRSEREKRRQIEKIDKLRRRHRRHDGWIMGAKDWKGIPSSEERRKWLRNKLLHYHDPQGWLLIGLQLEGFMLDGAKGEDAKNIGALIRRMPPHRFARRFARMLLEDE